MKNKASGYFKQIITAITTMAKAKTLAFKSKTRAIKARLVIFSLLQNKNTLISSISHKLNALAGKDLPKSKDQLLEDDVASVSGDKQSKAIVVYNSNNAVWRPSASTMQTEMEVQLQQGNDYEDGDDDENGLQVEKYPDFTHSLFDSKEIEFEDPGGSVIDIVKNSKEDKGEEFRLEDEIDRVADLFIKRFHRQMRLQKQQSLKRQQELLERTV